jgi:uncharacterized protein (DUF433 family)
MENQRIVISPKIMAGKPTIKGTRIPVDLIINLLSQGFSTQEILEEYPQLKKVDIKAALAYAARVTKGEDVFLVKE